MSATPVLIVGAGAVGVATGYHLSLGGAAVTFLVRASKLPEMQAPQWLYCYDDAQLKRFDQYQVLASIAEATASPPDFVLVTLDGATCRGAEGTALLTELADAIRASTAVMVIAGVGVRDYIAKITRLPLTRLLEGTLGSLSYQVQRVTLPVYPPTDPVQLNKASMAYRHINKNVGFMLAAEPQPAARDFAALYDRCGISRCTVMNVNMYSIVGTVFFPITAVCDLAGWPNAKAMAMNKPLMSLCAASIKEIMLLPPHHSLGQWLRWFVSARTLGMLLSKIEKNCLPLDFHAFNQFHHGGKVREQDIQVMQQCADLGKANQQPMPALDELLRRYRQHVQQRALAA